MSNSNEQTKIILNSLNYNSENKIELTNLIRPNEDPDILKNLQLYFNERYSNSISDYLDSINKEEMDFYKRFSDFIPNSDSMNPHYEYKAKEYFVDEIGKKKLNHLKELNQLLEKNGELNLIHRNKARKGILHIGEMGSGKTFSQNIWLYENNEVFESNNIVWIRLDAAKLIELWRKNFSITIQDYLLGQTVYVFAKHFIRESNLCSRLFADIADKLEHSEYNKIPPSNIKTKEQARNSDSHQEIFRYHASLHGITTIIGYLKKLRKEISIHENSFKGENDRGKKNERRHLSKSFLIDKVLKEPNKTMLGEGKSKIVWNEIGEILSDFIKNNGYYLFYIIDGIDNINHYFDDYENYIEKIIIDLFDFPLKNLDENDNELLLISLRDTTYEELKIHYSKSKYHDNSEYKNIELFDKIFQYTKDIPLRVFEERIKFVFKKTEDINDTFMKRVMSSILDYHNIPEEERWNSNIRCFMYNHLNLAKYITYRFYFSGTTPDNFNIREQIDNLEDTNFLLNGELFIDEDKRSPLTNRGDNLFNFFGYLDENKMPCYLIYTRLLQIVDNNPDISIDKLERITDIFSYNSDDVRNCMDKLIESGCLKNKYIIELKEIRYSITKKGKYALKIFFSNIHFLYHTSIDTKLPREIINKFKYSQNNFAPSTYGKKYYKPYSIITGIQFLQFLIDYNNYELKMVLNKTNGKTFDKKLYELHIDKKELESTINQMVEKCYKNSDDSFKDMLIKHFN